MSMVLRWIERPRDASVFDEARADGFTPLQADVLAGRFSFEEVRVAGGVRAALAPPLSKLDAPHTLPDIGKASERIVRAIVSGERIGLCTDVDVDGSCSHALLYTALTKHFGVDPSRVISEISHKTREGYGVTQPVVDRLRARADRPTLIITADQGSSDEPRIAQLAEFADVIVTDHHGLPPAGPPRSAYAVVNPCRADSRFPDRLVAGCFVAWLVMCAVRELLIKRGALASDAPKLADLVDFVAVATVADCVSMRRSPNNRAIVATGLRRMNASPRPCWRALASSNGGRLIDAATLAFTIGPRINARARMSEPMAAVHCLLSRTDNEAATWSAMLDADNRARREVERVMVRAAKVEAERQVRAGAAGLAVYIEDGMSGVQGVVASRLVDAFGRPTICLTSKPDHADALTGSLRSVAGFDVRAALARIAEDAPDLLDRWGGHAGAAGVALNRANLARLAIAWDAEVLAALSAEDIGPRLMHDGIHPDPASREALYELACLDPFGREFEAPVFADTFAVCSVSAVGRDRAHLRLSVANGRSAGHDAIWFNAPDGTLALLVPGSRLRMAYEPYFDDYRNRMGLRIRAATPI